MNTGFLGPAVATVLTVYGIDTRYHHRHLSTTYNELQQYLPFTVLKQAFNLVFQYDTIIVATVLTVYGIETNKKFLDGIRSKQVATVLTVYGIETKIIHYIILCVCSCNSTYRLRY